MTKPRYRKDLAPPEHSFTNSFHEALKDEEAEVKRWQRQIRDKISDVVPREYVQIVDPAEVDTTLLELIEDRVELFTDNLFFELVCESPKYLAYEPFQNKIALWQGILHDSSVDESTRNAARDRLQNIGSSLSSVGSGRKPRNDEMYIYYKFVQLQKNLGPVINKIRNMRLANRKLTFKENLPSLKKYAHHLLTNKTARSLAKQIICEEHDIGERTLEKIISEREAAVNNTRVPAKSEAD